MQRLAAALFLALWALATPALAQPTDARAAWKSYAWKRISLADCSLLPPGFVCPPFHEKWDWKRNQWVDMSVTFGTGTVAFTQRLTNRDRHDEDWVCVTAIVMDKSGRALAIHHQNWHSDPGEVREASFSYAISPSVVPATVVIGSRQCRKGAHEEDAVYEQALSGILR